MPLDPSSVLLTDRVALITGAAAGIGRGVAETFARFGADVALCDRDEPNLAAVAQEAEALGRRVVTGVFDVREPDAVADFCTRVGRELGRVDILVNNAGGTFRCSFLDVNAKGQDALVRENFTSVTLFVRAVVPLMPPDGGSIINLTSIEAHRAGPEYAIYSAMKAAVANLTKSLALELGDRQIRVNCIAPDLIPTEGELGAGGVERQRLSAPRTPLLRHGDVDDVSGTALFLASDLSAYITGSTIHVDGGNLAAAGWHRVPGDDEQSWSWWTG